LLRRFRQALDQGLDRHPIGPSWEDPKRRLHAPDYLSLFLFGLLNPVAQTLRGFAGASRRARVQAEDCSRVVP
jgi:hypothetical protein